jgi:hypothetical protein
MISSSGIIKRGLAATAISALAIAGVPMLADSASAAASTKVVVSSVDGFSAFDVDEFIGAPNDFIATLTDAANAPSVGEAVTYSYTFTPTVGAPVVGPFAAAPGVTDAAGKIAIPAPAAPAEGTYALTVKSPTATSATFTFVAGESEIELADGVSASSPQNGVDNYAGTLALTNPAATPLPGRTVNFTYVGAGNAVLTQTAAITSATGGFSAQLTDPAVPAATETGTLTATATALQGPGDVPTADASDSTVVTFEPAPVVKAVTVTKANVFGPSQVGPGKPVELNVQVTSEGPTPAPGDDIVLKDYPVAFTVDKGFLTKDVKAGLNMTPNDLLLTADQDDLGDRFGFYQSLDATETVDTSDDQAPPLNAAGIVATIAKDAGFNDDGLVDQKVTVTAGGKSATETITYDSRDYLNIAAVAFRKDGGSTKIPGPLDLKFYAADQFGNLVGDQQATIADNTPIARVTPEPGGATTDFLNDNPSATASSNQPVTQTVTGRVNADKNTVAANGDLVNGSETVTGNIVLNWTKGGGSGQTGINAKLTGQNNGPAADVLTVKAPAKAAGAVVKLFKVVGGKNVPAGTKILKANGKVSFTKAD